MKTNKIYLTKRFSQHDLDLLKKDLLSNFIEFTLRIKNLGFTRVEVEEVVDNVVNDILNTHDFAGGQVLGDVIKTSLVDVLKAKHLKRYPNMVNKVKWPQVTTVAQKSMARTRIFVLHSLKTNNKAILGEIYNNLTSKQRDLLATVLKSPPLISYTELSKKTHMCVAAVSNNMKTIYSVFMKEVNNNVR